MANRIGVLLVEVKIPDRISSDDTERYTAGKIDKLLNEWDINGIKFHSEIEKIRTFVKKGLSP